MNQAFLIDQKINFIFKQKLLQVDIITPNKYYFYYQMFSRIYTMISERLQREFTRLMRDPRFVRGLVLVLKYGFALLIIILFGSVISMLVEIIMAVLLAVIKYFINILTHIAEMMKDNLILLGILILFLALTQRITINKIAYRAFLALISDDEATCSICVVNDVDPCDYIEPNCGNSFHKQHMDNWLQDHTTCPLCIRVVPVIGRRCQKVVYPQFFGHMLRLRKVQSGLIILGFLFFNAVFQVI